MLSDLAFIAPIALCPNRVRNDRIGANQRSSQTAIAIGSIVARGRELMLWSDAVKEAQARQTLSSEKVCLGRAPRPLR